jgi:hypothetical protein
MSTPNDGGPAFPKTTGSFFEDGSGGIRSEGGMSLRDWFAGQALASSDIIHPQQAYEIADLMLEARNRKKETS